MKRCWYLCLIAAVSLSLAACGEEDTGPELPALPQAPQIIPSALTLVLPFDLQLVGSPGQTLHVLFENGGQDKLVINEPEITGRDAAAFALGEITPASREIESRTSLTVPITFTPSARGVFLAELVVTSNAENDPQLIIELVGPGTADNTTALPDIALFESDVTVAPYGDAGVQLARVAFYNLGAATLQATQYEIVDTASFAFVPGTANPGATCSGDEGCNGLGCETDQCAAVRVVSGRFVLIPVVAQAGAAAGATTEVRIHSDDADTPVAVVTVHAP